MTTPTPVTPPQPQQNGGGPQEQFAAYQAFTAPPPPAPVSAHLFDLDVLEREGAKIPPFTFVHNGKSYELLDPAEMDWQDLLTGFRNPQAFIRFALRTEDRQSFLGSPLAAWKLNKLFEAYLAHYKLNPGNSDALLG